jgi:hypothetical protein
VRKYAARVCGVGVFGCAFALVGDALGQTPSEIATAKRWFAEGLASEEKGDFAGALDLFRRAVQIKRTPQIVYHLGFCESRTGALVEALVDLDSAASLARSAAADKVVSAAEGELAEVKKRVPTLEVHVVGADKPDRLTVDGQVVALSMLGTPMPLDPGSHTVAVAFASGATVTNGAALAEHDVKTVDVTPPAPVAVTPPPPPVVVAPVAPLPEPPPPLPPPPRAEPSHPSVLPWVVTGVGGAALATGVGLFVAAHLDVGTLDSNCSPAMVCNPSQKPTYTQAQTFDAIGITLGVVGLVATGAGVTMLVLRPSSSSSAALVVGPTGAAWTGRF